MTDVIIRDEAAPGCDNDLGSLNPGQSGHSTCSVTNVTAAFTNTAVVTGTTEDVPGLPPTEISEEDSAVVYVRTEVNPSITIDKSPDMQVVSAGDTVTFTIAVTNTGDITLTEVTVTDPLANNCAADFGVMGPGVTKNKVCSIDDVMTGFTNVATVTADVHGTGGKVIDNDSAVVEVVPNVYLPVLIKPDP